MILLVTAYWSFLTQNNGNLNSGSDASTSLREEHG